MSNETFDEMVERTARRQVADAVLELPHVAGPLAHRIRFMREQFMNEVSKLEAALTEALTLLEQASRRAHGNSGFQHPSSVPWDECQHPTCVADRDALARLRGT